MGRRLVFLGGFSNLASINLPKSYEKSVLHLRVFA
jgi:hypothetical protein